VRRVRQRGERKGRACGGEDVHREGAGAHNHAVLDRDRGRAPASNIAGTH
jgi:hypothetical protein